MLELRGLLRGVLGYACYSCREIEKMCGTARLLRLNEAFEQGPVNQTAAADLGGCQLALGVPAILFVSLRKQNYQFTVHVFRRAVRLGLTAGCDNHRTHESRAGIAVFVGV